MISRFAKTFSTACQAAAGDVAHKSDGFAVVKVAAVAVATRPGEHVRHLVVTWVERQQGTRAKPLETKAMARRLHAVAGDSPVTVDGYYALDVIAEWQALGRREADDLSKLRGRRYLVAKMHAAAQTSRFKLLREYVHGNRLHVPDTEAGRLLLKELGELQATELHSGLLRIEGLHTDDLADALALAVEVAHVLPPDVFDAEGGRLELQQQVRFEHGAGLDVQRQWVRVLPNGRRVPAECPRSSRHFEEHALASIAAGTTTPAIEEWIAEQEANGRRIIR